MSQSGVVRKRQRGDVNMAAEGIIILAHGSKRKSTNRVAKVFRQIVSAAFPGKLVEAAYLQLSKPTLERSVEKLNLVGVTKITIVPLFLFDGVHVTRDIPM